MWMLKLSDQKVSVYSPIFHLAKCCHWAVMVVTLVGNKYRYFNFVTIAWGQRNQKLDEIKDYDDNVM